MEIWDAVDHTLEEESAVGHVDDDDAPAGMSGSRAASAAAPRKGPLPLDASHIDVYKGAHCVVVLFDVTRRETWDAALATLAAVPARLPAVLLGNFRDCVPAGAAPAVPLAEAQAAAAAASRARGDGDEPRVQAFETSLLNCYGLKVLYNYLNIPFLELKAAVHAEQLKLARADLITVRLSARARVVHGGDWLRGAAAGPATQSSHLRPRPRRPPFSLRRADARRNGRVH